MSDQIIEPDDGHARAAVVEHFRSAILAQQIYTFGVRLPSVRQVASQLGVSSKTAHRALTDLVAAGLVRVADREGFTVTYNVHNQATMRAEVSGMRTRGFMDSPADVAVIDSASMRPTWPALSDRFGIDTGAEAVCRAGRIVREQRTVGFRTSWFHPVLVPLVPELLDPASTGSIARIERTTGKTVRLTDDDFTVDLASEHQAQLFGVPKNDPILIMEATRIFREDGMLVELGISVYPRGTHLALEYRGQ